MVRIMEDKKEWDRFLQSGKVEDYLKYAAKAKSGRERETGTYAGFTDSDRPRPEGGADRRI